MGEGCNSITVHASSRKSIWTVGLQCCPTVWKSLANRFHDRFNFTDHERLRRAKEEGKLEPRYSHFHVGKAISSSNRVEVLEYEVNIR